MRPLTDDGAAKDGRESDERDDGERDGEGRGGGEQVCVTHLAISGGEGEGTRVGGTAW